MVQSLVISIDSQYGGQEIAHYYKCMAKTVLTDHLTLNKLKIALGRNRVLRNSPALVLYHVFHLTQANL